MQRNILLLVLVVSAFFVSGCTSGGELFKQSVQRTAPKSKVVGSSFAPVGSEFVDPYGTVLTAQDGKAIYTYEEDSEGVSNCYDECAIIWPPVLVNYPEEVGGEYSVLQRTDGALQVMLNGQPLYTYTPDALQTVLGDGKDGKWNVVVVE